MLGRKELPYEKIRDSYRFKRTKGREGCVCVCVCVYEMEMERQRQRETERETEREKEECLEKKLLLGKLRTKITKTE